MSLQPDFTRASYSEPSLAAPEAGPVSAQPAAAAPALLVRAIAFGLVGAALGAVLYGGFIQLTHIQIGYLAIVVAWLVAKAMTMGSGERGGRPFQIAAVLLTLVAVAAGNALMLYWDLGKEGAIRLTPYNLAKLLQFGFEEPFLEFRSSPAGAAIGLFILFIGLRAAWRMTSGVPGAARHPFAR